MNEESPQTSPANARLSTIQHRLWTQMQWAMECNDLPTVARLAAALKDLEMEIGPLDLDLPFSLSSLS